MQSTIQIIEGIKIDAAALKNKVMSLPSTVDQVSVKQQSAIDSTQKSLLGWIGWDLGELEKAFFIEDP